MQKKHLVIGLVLVAAGAAVYFFSGGDEGVGPKTQAVTIRADTVKVQDMPINIAQVGTVVANQTVAVRSRLDSQLVEVKFKDGDAVQEGDVLFVLDDKALTAQLRQAQATLANLKAQYERSKALILKKFISQADLDKALADYESQKAAADVIATQLEYTRITAPISGRTGTINVTLGNTVKANDTTPLVTINQLKPIRVQVSLPQQYLDSVRTAMAQGEVLVSARRDNAAEAGASQGKLEYIDNTVDQASGTFAARALFANEDEALWPGMFVTLELTLGEQKQALTIPEVAIQRGQEEDFVFVIQGNKAERRAVKILRIQSNTAVIDSGLKAGETVAVDGLMSLKSGSDVTVNSAKSEEKIQ